MLVNFNCNDGKKDKTKQNDNTKKQEKNGAYTQDRKITTTYPFNFFLEIEEGCL